MKKKDRALGLRCLRRFKLWERAARQCDDYAVKLEELLLQMDQVEVTQQVSVSTNSETLRLVPVMTQPFLMRADA